MGQNNTQQQETSFNRLEDYDSRNGVHVRRIRTDTTMNLFNTATNTTTGDATLASTVVPAGMEVALYAFQVSFSALVAEPRPVAVQIDGVTVYAISPEGFTPTYIGEPEVNPIGVAEAGSTISIVELGKTVTGDLLVAGVIGKVRPIPSRVESELGSL